MPVMPVISTYRLQMRSDGMTFDDALALLPYLDELGVSHLYLSPVLTAASGSTHGYDVTDHSHVNDELGELDRGLAASERLLRPGGRLAVVSFHSLEDRRVKEFLRRRSGNSPAPSRHAPVERTAEAAPTFRLISRKPVTPGDTELVNNPRARSARLRAAERTKAPAFEEAA